MSSTVVLAATALGVRLEPAAHALGASGVAVWVESPDERSLSLLASHGYGQAFFDSVGPIPVDAPVMTAMAFREQRLATRQQRGAHRAAVAAPIIGDGQTVGVLTVEFDAATVVEVESHVVARAEALASQVALLVLSAAPVSGRSATLDRPDATRSAGARALRLAPVRPPVGPAVEEAAPLRQASEAAVGMGAAPARQEPPRRESADRVTLGAAGRTAGFRAPVPERGRVAALVVNDDPNAALLTKVRLTDGGHTTVIARDGQEALDVVEACAPAVVVLELMLANESGFDVLERLRQRPEPRPRILVVSSRASEADVMRAFELGADDYLAKPFERHELPSRVGRLLQ